MKNKGFTLIELLAVIVILAIIALIVVPIILNVVENVKKKAAESSALGYLDAVEQYVVLHDIDLTQYPENLEKDIEYNVSDLNSFISIKGKKPTSGTITIDSNGKIDGAELVIGKYRVACTSTTCKATKADSTNDATKADSTNDTTTGPTIDTTVQYSSANVEQSGLIGVAYLDPTDLTKICTESNSTVGSGTEGCMKWYIFKEDSTTYTMILDHNTTSKVAWNSSGSNSSMKEVYEQLLKDTAEWDSNLSPRLITADEIASISGNESFDAETSTNSSAFYLDSNTTTSKANSKGASKYAWLYDYTNGCEEHGCNVADSSNKGYWTSSKTYNTSNSAWAMSNWGNFDDFSVTVTNRGGIRPVITVDKSILKSVESTSSNGPTIDKSDQYSVSDVKQEGLIGVAYLNPTNLNKHCDASNTKKGLSTYANGCMKWYIFKEDSTTYTMILDHNTTSKVAWNSSGSNSSMKEVYEQLLKDTAEWDSNLSPRLITADEIASISGNESFDAETSTNSSAFYLDSNTTTSKANSKGASKYAWLYDYTNGCEEHGCNVADSSNKGYWTSSKTYNTSNSAWAMSNWGNFDDFSVTVTNRGGIRPVITVDKSIFK